MSTGDLLQAVTRAGGRLIPEGGDKLTVEAPAPLSDDLMAELRAHKAEILAYLTRPVPTCEEVLGWTFADVDRHRARIKIRSRLLDCDLWLVATGDPGPGDGLPVYTTDEVRELLKLRPENLAAKVQAAHLAKMSFGPAARIEEVLPA
jgi:hypothetical protein